MSFTLNQNFPALFKGHPILIVPGLRNSDEQHWQSLWQARLPNSRRIQLEDWNTPDLDKWKTGILAELNKHEKPALIIAHSFGTLASASIAAEFPEKIAALFLVAPADPDKFQIANRLPQTFLRVPTKIIASSNDPWLSESKAADWASHWGADFLRLKNVGHINSDSNLGLWTEGMQQLQQLLHTLKKPHLAVSSTIHGEYAA